MKINYTNSTTEARISFIMGLITIIVILMSALSATAQPNNNCASATVLTVGAACTNGTNVGSTLELGEPSPACWLTVANTTVWYRFTTGTAGNYVISTDNGGTTDTQIQLYSSACGIYTPVVGACSEDNGTVNTLAAVVSASLAAATQYWIQVDVYSTATGTFCINVFQVFPPANDCVMNATDITTLINPVSTSNPVQCNYNFNYNATASTGDDPTRQDIVGDPNGCNGVDATLIPRPAHYDIWYKFTVTAATPNAYLQLFPNTGTTAILAMALYSGTPNAVCPAGNITGLTQVDCSVGEVTDVPPMNIPGGARDKAICSTPIHPRLNVGGLSPGTYYLRVWDFGGFNPPNQGTFNLCAESTDPRPNTSDACPSSANIGYLGTSRNVNVNTTYTGLSNAGATGNAYGAVTSNPLICTGANTNEPLLGATPAGDARLGCGGGWTTYVGGVNNIMNVTVIHAFTVNACGPGCEPAVTVKLNNIVSEGLPGNAAQLQVMAPGNCTGSTQTVMNAISNASCIEMRPAGNAPLVNGTYYIVVDGQDGQLLEYDLTLTLTYPCAVDTDAAGLPCILPLPVALTTFSARHEDAGNILEWKTASEINNAYFQIERSTDAKSFSVIGQMAGAGNSTTINAYTFTDRNPGTAKNYYRLKQVDFNGAVTYSKIVLINDTRAGLEISSISPNPAKDKIEIMLSAGNTQYLRAEVINTLGRTVMSYDNGTKNSNPMQADISSLEAGYYILKITDTLSGEVIVRNFVKQ